MTNKVYLAFGKRGLDLVAALALSLMLLPLLLIIGLVLRLTQGSPVLFKQRRPGFHGEPFTVMKFRSMREPRDDKGNPVPECERVTRIGGVLRATSLDELPELFNVIRGDMSFVGPRPLKLE